MTQVDAYFATLCSYLGLTARDLAEMGEFSERFARDLLAGRRPFPKDVQQEIIKLRAEIDEVVPLLVEIIRKNDPKIYIYKTLKQYRAAPIYKVWPTAFLGPYRVAAMRALEKANEAGLEAYLVFPRMPHVPEEADDE